MKQLKVLKASYYSNGIPNFETLSRLEKLEEVHLTQLNPSQYGFNCASFESMPKLKNYSVDYGSAIRNAFASERDCNHRQPCPLERLRVDFTTENDLYGFYASIKTLYC